MVLRGCELHLVYNNHNIKKHRGCGNLIFFNYRPNPDLKLNNTPREKIRIFVADNKYSENCCTSVIYYSLRPGPKYFINALYQFRSCSRILSFTSLRLAVLFRRNMRNFPAHRPKNVSFPRG